MRYRGPALQPHQEDHRGVSVDASPTSPADPPPRDWQICVGISSLKEKKGYITVLYKSNKILPSVINSTINRFKIKRTILDAFGENAVSMIPSLFDI